MSSLVIVLGCFILLVLILRLTGRAARQHSSRLGRDMVYRPLAIIPEFTEDELREMAKERKRR